MSSRRIHYFGLGAMLGGVAWVAYGIFLLLQPWGVAQYYRDELGYEVVTRPLLYQIYYLPGSGALCLLALGLVGIGAQLPLPLRRPGKAGAILTYLTMGLGVLGVVGTVSLFASLSVAGRSFGVFSLGAAMLLLGIELRRRHGTAQWRWALLAMGALGVLMFALWPLVFALQLISAGVATLFMALFGLGWVALGYRLVMKPG